MLISVSQKVISLLVYLKILNVFTSRMFVIGLFVVRLHGFGDEVYQGGKYDRLPAEENNPWQF